LRILRRLKAKSKAVASGLVRALKANALAADSDVSSYLLALGM
jgi:hypothetical protein